MKPLAIHPAAESEIWTELQFYEDKQEGLGRELKLEIKAALARIQQHPRAFAADRRKVRRCALRRFPFSIAFRDETDLIWVLALAHHRRKPNYWQIRLRDG
jgi:toxin ParE1/3/4